MNPLPARAKTHKSFFISPLFLTFFSSIFSWNGLLDRWLLDLWGRSQGLWPAWRVETLESRVSLLGAFLSRGRTSRLSIVCGFGIIGRAIFACFQAPGVSYTDKKPVFIAIRTSGGTERVIWTHIATWNRFWIMRIKVCHFFRGRMPAHTRKSLPLRWKVSAVFTSELLCTWVVNGTFLTLWCLTNRIWLFLFGRYALEVPAAWRSLISRVLLFRR